MIAHELISDIIPPLKTSDSIQRVVDRMDEFRVNHLPIVDNLEFLGIVSDQDLIEILDYDLPISEVSLSLHNTFATENQHIYDVIRLIYQFKLTLVPVLDSANNYLGVISSNTVMEYFATLTAVKEQGGIIVIEISNRNNSLSHIAQIVESNNAQILSSYVRTFPDSTRIEITLKLNRIDITAIIASLLRYDYTVKETFNDIKQDNDTLDRFDQFMNYLNI